MGRFYKTTDPQMLDFMYKLPENLYMNVIQNVDRDIATKEAQTLSLYDKLQMNALYKDEPRRQEIVKGYESRVDELTRKLAENPLEFRKQEGSIRQLARDIHEDWTRGEAAAIQGNFAARETYKKKYAELVAAGKANAADFNAAMNYFDKNFQGTSYNKDTNLYNQYITEDLAKFINIEDIAETRGQGYLADVTEKLGAFKEGNYLYTSKDKTKRVTYEEIHNGVITAMQNDKELMDYYKQQIKFGVYTPEQVTKMINDAAHRVSNKYSFLEQEKGRTSINEDQFALQADRYAREKDLHGWKENFKLIQNVATDRNNEQAKYNTVLGKDPKTGIVTLQTRDAAIKSLKDNANKPIDLLQQQLLQQYSNMGNNNPAEYQKILDAIAAAKQGNFTDIKAILPNYNIGTQDGFGDIKQIENQWKATNNQIENDNRVVNAIRNKTREDLIKKDPTLAWDINRLETQLEQQVNKTLSDPNFNNTTLSVYSTQGDYFDNQNIPIQQRALFKAHLDAVGKQLSTDYMGAKMFITDEKGNVLPSTINSLIREGIMKFSQYDEENEKGEIKFFSGGKEITLKRGDTRIVPQELPTGVGQDSYQTSIIMNDPQTGQPKKYNVYVPQDALPMDAEMKAIVDSKRTDIMVDETVRKAEVKFRNAIEQGHIKPEDALYQSDYTSSVQYNPADNGTWYFKLDDGKTHILKGSEGKEYYNALLRNKYPAGYNNDYNFSKGKTDATGSGGYSSKTTTIFD